MGDEIILKIIEKFPDGATRKYFYANLVPLPVMLGAVPFVSGSMIALFVVGLWVCVVLSLVFSQRQNRRDLILRELGRLW